MKVTFVSNSYVNTRSIMVLIVAMFLLVQPLAGVTAAASLWSDTGPGPTCMPIIGPGPSVIF